MNKHVAHLDRNRPNPGLTIGGLHEEADKLYQIFHRWYEFLCNEGLTIPSVEQWETDFTKPWITFEQASEISHKRVAEAEELAKQLRSQALGAIYLPDRPRPF